MAAVHPGALATGALQKEEEVLFRHNLCTLEDGIKPSAALLRCYFCFVLACAHLIY
jgi:hypothetical protein